MAQPTHNPFYVLLLLACALLLVTMFVYLMGFWQSVAPGLQGPADQEYSPLRLWMDRNAITLIACEVAAVIVLSGLTIGLDRFFDKKPTDGSTSK
ncbi:MAG: hypothetical protein U1D30_16615 [Planctomycetota bacterium]